MTIEGFLNYLTHERNYSAMTVKSYGEDLSAFEEFFRNLDAELSWESVDSDVIRDWMESMMDKANSAATVNRRLSALRSFYRYGMRQGLVEANPARDITGPKKGKPLPQFVKEGEMNRLIDDVSWGDTFKDTRARTIIILLYETGMRASELTGLDDSMVDMATRQLKVTGKRNKQRLIPFGEELAAQLQAYIRRRDQEVARQDDALFVSDKGQRLSYQQLRSEVRRCLSMVTTIKKRSPHVLRHTFATAMLNHEANLEGVKNLLGHESLATTQVYTHTTFEQLKKTYDNAHPRA